MNKKVKDSCYWIVEGRGTCSDCGNIGCENNINQEVLDSLNEIMFLEREEFT